METMTMIQFNQGDLKTLVKEAVKEALSELASKRSNKSDELLNVKQAAKITGYQPGYIYELVHKRKIPFVKAPNGRAIRFKKSELEAWIKAGRPDLMQDSIDRMSDNYLVNGGNGNTGE